MVKGKDPASLFFWNDWHTGTMTMSRHLKGCYMDLLCAQFNSGHLTIEEIKIVLGNDFAAWQGALSKKFAKDELGLFFNVKMDFELKKRKDFSLKQSERVSKRYRTSTETLPIMEIGNENGIENEKLKMKFSEWLDFRIEKKKPVSISAGKKQLEFLKKHSVEDAFKIINQSIMNDWQGLFELNSKNKINNRNDSISSAEEILTAKL